MNSIKTLLKKADPNRPKDLEDLSRALLRGGYGSGGPKVCVALVFDKETLFLPFSVIKEEGFHKLCTCMDYLEEMLESMEEGDGFADAFPGQIGYIAVSGHRYRRIDLEPENSLGEGKAKEFKKIMDEIYARCSDRITKPGDSEKISQVRRTWRESVVEPPFLLLKSFELGVVQREIQNKGCSARFLEEH